MGDRDTADEPAQLASSGIRSMEEETRLAGYGQIPRFGQLHLLDPLSGRHRYFNPLLPDTGIALRISEGPQPQHPDPFTEEMVLNSLDQIYRESELTYEITLPGLADFFEQEDPNTEAVTELLEKAPHYFSQHILDLCSQSKQLRDEVIAKQFTLTETGKYRFRTSFWNDFWLKIRGYKATEPYEKELSLPVFDLTFPKNECKIDLKSANELGGSTEFKIDVPGFACGAGKRRSITFSNDAQGLKQNVQAHVLAVVEVRPFTKDGERIQLVQILRVDPAAYLVTDSDISYFTLPEPQSKIHHQILGLAGDADAADEIVSGLEIQEGSWARFSMRWSEILSLALLDSPPIGVGHEIRSEALSRYSISFRCPTGKIYRLSGANSNSLRLFIDFEREGGGRQ